MEPKRRQPCSQSVAAIVVTRARRSLNRKCKQPLLLSYLLGLINAGLLWNNRGQFVRPNPGTSDRQLGANLFPFFWRSLAPFLICCRGSSAPTTAAAP